MSNLESSIYTLPTFSVDVVEKDQPGNPHSIRCEIGKNINFCTQGLEAYCFSNWEPLVYDVFVLAAAIQFCDHVTRRPSAKWGRQIELMLPVHEPDRWNSMSVSGTLHDALDFLTGDSWMIKFKPRNVQAESPRQQNMNFANDTEVIVAYSEGLDSLVVSKLEELKIGQNLLRVRLGSNSKFDRATKNDPFALVPYKVSYCEKRSVEPSSRSRGFKFSLLSGVAAHMCDASKIIVPESGQGVLGPALIPVGQYYEDYRNHPRFTNRMKLFLSAIFNKEIQFIYPRLWSTKGETLKEYIDSENFNSTEWKSTRSCWQDQRHVSVLGQRRQCGICAACLLRRMSVNFAGLVEDKEVYLWENLNVASFRKGIAYGAKEPTKAQKEHSIAGIQYINNLAGILSSDLNKKRLNLHVNQLSRTLGILDIDIKSNLERLLRRHDSEWRSFLHSLGPNSFVSQWL